MQPFQQHNNDHHRQTLAEWQNDYHHAISLNNLGIHLLQQQCYVQAMECLEHAATLMPYRLLDPASSPSEAAPTTTPTTTGTATTGDADAAASEIKQPQQAQPQHSSYQHFFSRPKKPAKKCVALLDTLTITPCGMLIVGETHSSHNNSNNMYGTGVIDSLLQVIPGSGIFFMVRMEDVVVCNDAEHVLPDMTLHSQPQPQQAVLTRQAAIATYNLGLACLCISKTIRANCEQRDILKQRFLQAALQYGRISATVLVKQLRMMMQVEEHHQQEQQQQQHSEQPKRTGSELLEHEARLLLLEGLTLVALHTYLQMLQEAKQKEHAMSLYQQLVDVRSNALEHRYASEQSWAGIWNTLIRSGETAAAA